MGEAQKDYKSLIRSYESIFGYWPGSHTSCVLNHIQDFIFKDNKKVDVLAISMPPRSSKTTISEHLARWYSEYNANKKIVLMSYSCNIFKRDIPALVITPWHNLCGLPIGLLIIDDYLKDLHQSESVTFNEKFNDWFNNLFYNRLDFDAKVVILNSRWSSNDVIGHLLSENKNNEYYNIKHINIPALVEDMSFWPSRYTCERLLHIKNVIGAKYWESLYQGCPGEV